MEALLKRKKQTQVRKNKDKLKGWAIVRVSKENLTQDGSPDQQLATIKRWEKQQKERTGKTYEIVNYIIEDGVSGRYQNTHKRKDILHLLDLVKMGAIDFIVAERLNRISRDEVLNLQLMRDAREKSVELHEINYGQFNPLDRGQRMGWKFRNIEAGEYSEGVSEDVARKLRQAMVHNGKDPSPCPTLGLDSHSKYVGYYEPNKDELAAWEDIARNFVALNCSRQATIEHCKKKGYKTKIWWTKEKVKNGEIIKPKRMGGMDFDWQSLLRLLGNPRIRGYNYFYDNWNMFNDLQDDEGWVCWEYRHHKEYGDLVSRKLIKQVDLGLEKTTYCSRSNDFLLSCILYAPDGSRYYGEAAKSGKNPYYYNRSQRKRFPADHIHKLVLKRLEELLEKSNLEKLIGRIQSHDFLGTPKFLSKRQQLMREIRRLHGVVENFSTALRDSVTQNKDSLVEVIETMIEEKKRAQEEIARLKQELHNLAQQENRFREALKGDKFKRFVKTALSKMKSMHPLEQKNFVQAVIPKMVIHSGEKGYYLQLFYNLNTDPQDLGGPSRGRPAIPRELYCFDNVVPLFRVSTLPCNKEKRRDKNPSGPLRVLEDNFWPLVMNGRPSMKEGQNLFSAAYLIDFMELFQPQIYRPRPFSGPNRHR